MCRRDFETSCAELNVYISIFDYRNFTTYQRHNYTMSMQPCVLRVLGIDAHCRISHDSLGSCCGHQCVVPSVFVCVYHLTFGRGNLAIIGKVVSQIEEVAVFLDVVYFVIGYGRKVCRVPVDHV